MGTFLLSFQGDIIKEFQQRIIRHAPSRGRRAPPTRFVRTNFA
jgi:hypothetical protein